MDSGRDVDPHFTAAVDAHSDPGADPDPDPDSDHGSDHGSDRDDTRRVDTDLSLDPATARLLTALVRLDPAQARTVRAGAARARPRPQSGPRADYGGPGAG